jgi:hypothetical protein
MKKLVCGGLLVTMLFSSFALTGCKKKQMQPQQGQMGQQLTPQKVETVLVVPEGVKNKWKAVKLNVTDKTTNKSQIITVEIGKETQIPGTDLKVFVETFLPAFKMEGGTITSTSVDQTTNPAVKIKVTEKNEEVFKGWLFELYPQVHPFNHPKYALSLAGYEKK